MGHKRKKPILPPTIHAMPQQDDLHRLIRSLTSSEKRYIKVMAGKAGDEAQYLKLFDAIDSFKGEYNEDQLRSRYAKEKFVKFLAAEKKNLMAVILRAMRAFHADSTVDNQLHDLLQDESFLQSKGLVELRKKVIAKAKEIAQAHERFPALYQIVEREFYLTLENNAKDLVEESNRLMDERDRTMNTLFQLHKVTLAKEEAFIAMRSGMDFKNPANVEYMSELSEKYAPDGQAANSSTLAAIQAWGLQALAARAKGDLAATRDHYSKILDCYKQHPEVAYSNSISYKSAISNYLVYANSTRDYSRFENLLAELKALPSTNFYEEGEVFQNVYFIEHIYYLNQGRLDDAAQLVPAILEGIEKFKGKVSPARELTFFYNIMVMYFMMDNYREALKMAETIMDYRSDVRQDVQISARIFHLICHFELGHAEIMESLTRSVYRHLMGQQRLHGFERIMVKFLGEMPFQAQEKDRTKLLAQLLADLNGLSQNDEEKSRINPGRDEVTVWCTAKKEGRTNQEVFVRLSAKNCP